MSRQLAVINHPRLSLKGQKFPTNQLVEFFFKTTYKSDICLLSM
jgi:hypothetical protein